ncbi:kelch domain-containing protein 4-like [Liolophura sinensis]|uniref:kelch domain-containing protein 4-like n=1 Tax=Liolophura sinensis TaxID=3198878 RepID=UPI00315870AC
MKEPVRRVFLVTCLLVLCHETAAERLGWAYAEADTQSWPDARSGAASWADQQGGFWLFGGSGLGVGDNPIPLNDLWYFSQIEERWNMLQPRGVIPPGRYMASACGVSDLMFVVSGGLGIDGYGFDDTWVYSITNNTWLPLKNQTRPSARGEGATWCTDRYMYVFGGIHLGQLQSDHWQFSLEALTWTPVTTPGEEANQTDHNSESPSERNAAMTWVFKDSLYMFGGNISQSEELVYSSCLWSYSMRSRKWQLLHGLDNNQLPVYYNCSYVNCTPGGRTGSATWVDPRGYLWLFGGERLMWSRMSKLSAVFVGDTWVYDTTKNRWFWIAGKNSEEKARSVAAPEVSGFHFTPGARYGSTAWHSGNRFYLFAGVIHSSMSALFMNDLWYFQVFGDQHFTLGNVMLILIVAVLLVSVLIIVALLARRKGTDNFSQSTKYSLLMETTSFDASCN